MKKLIAAAAACAVVLATPALAQVYPSRPVTLIVPNPPGGPTDALARIFSERMRAFLGQPVIVENVTGASGIISIRRVIRAAPDGYTLSFGNIASHVFASLVSRRDYDLIEDLSPVGLLTISPMWMLAASALPAGNIRELIGWLKANPDKATAGHAGPGSPAHLCGLYFQNQTGTSFAFASYRGAGPIMQDLIAGQIDLACLEASATRPYVESGKLKAYAVMAKSRWSPAPDVPTIDEAGVPGLHIPFWHALWTPKATPSDVVGKLNAATVATLAEPAVRAPHRSRPGDSAPRATDAGSARHVSQGRDREMGADHQGCEHRAGMTATTPAIGACRPTNEGSIQMRHLGSSMVLTWAATTRQPSGNRTHVCI